MQIMRAVGLAALVGGLTLAVAAPASGHGIKYGRGVQGGFIPADGPPFTAATGKVNSGKAACRRASRVILFKAQPGRDIDYGSRLTNRQGQFTIPSPGNQFDDGAYYLVVKRKVLAKNRYHRHICPRLKTNAFTITNP